MTKALKLREVRLRRSLAVLLATSVRVLGLGVAEYRTTRHGRGRGAHACDGRDRHAAGPRPAHIGRRHRPHGIRRQSHRGRVHGGGTMSTQTGADHCVAGSGLVWVFAVTLAVGGCSSGSEALRAAGGQASPTASATASSTPSSTTTEHAFKQDSVDSAFAKKLGALCNDWNSFASSHQYSGGANPQAATVEELPKMAAWLDSASLDPGKTLVIGLDTIGSGEPVVVEAEGGLWPVRYREQDVAAAQDASADCHRSRLPVLAAAAAVATAFSY